MKREIKFRAWQSQEKKMYIQGDTVNENRTVFWKIWENSTHISEPMQFTGLTDKNGKEIYEGDLLVDWQSINEIRQEDGEQNFIAHYEVSYNNGEWVCHCIEEGIKYSHEELLVDLLRDSKEIEIVGNIYETKL